MANRSPSHLSDQELIDAIGRVAISERRTTAELVGLLAELDARRLYLGLGYSSLFVYCTQVLRLSEPAAYSRITAARLARQFPATLVRLADGDITLTTITLLAAHITQDNCEELLDAARHRSRRNVERLVASLSQQPDVPTSIRKLPATAPKSAESGNIFEPPIRPGLDRNEPLAPTAPPVGAQVIAPVSAHRYLLRVTISGETHAKLEHARALLRHTIPGGDLVTVIDRALTVLVEQLERQRVGAVRRPRTAVQTSKGRHVPAAVRRAVWTRDQGRCAFVGTHGRCTERGFLEFHHVVPYAGGGPTTTENLELRCRAHNAFEAERYFGSDRARKPTTDHPPAQ